VALVQREVGVMLFAFSVSQSDVEISETERMLRNSSTLLIVRLLAFEQVTTFD